MKQDRHGIQQNQSGMMNQYYSLLSEDILRECRKMSLRALKNPSQALEEVIICFSLMFSLQLLVHQNFFPPMWLANLDSHFHYILFKYPPSLVDPSEQASQAASRLTCVRCFCQVWWRRTYSSLSFPFIVSRNDSLSFTLTRQIITALREYGLIGLAQELIQYLKVTTFSIAKALPIISGNVLLHSLLHHCLCQCPFSLFFFPSLH